MSEVVTKNDLLKILDKLPSMVLPSTTTRISPAIGEGDVHYIQIGKIVLVAALIETTTALSTGEELITGLPSPKVNNANYTIANSNSPSDRLHYTYLQNGSLKYAGTAAAATRSFRISFAYIAI